MKVLSAAGAKYFLNKLKAIFAPNSNFVKSGSEAKAGLVPSPGTTAGTTKYLREDGTWQVPPDNNTTYSNMAAATASAAGKAGLVPAPAAGKQASFLRGDGTWQVPTNTTYSNFVGSGSNAKNGLVPSPGTTAGTTKYLREDGSWQVPPNATYSNFVKSGSGAKNGLVPAPPTTAGTTKYLREDGTWQVPPDNNTTYSNMTAATASAAGKAGLVPAPAAGNQGKFLRGDGTWQTPANTTYSNFVKSGSGAKNGLVPAPPTTAGTTKYLREDGTWQVPPDNNTTYSNFVKSGSGAKNGLVPAPPTTAGTTKYLREDGTWQVPPDNNTTYSAGTAALLTAGTDTANRVWQAKILKEYVKSIVSPSSSIAANGYVKLDSGLIIQWGNHTVSKSQGDKTISFNINFTSACYTVITTASGSSAEYDYFFQIKSYTNSNFIAHLQDVSGYIPDSPICYWVAIGK
ncbi:hypothetical protein [uncultured Succiniclasticum sp.]|uniref:gp53-like domain-containing protein n=1 Tax=uncultured Succiniclasticum sp. TaxID=1500547 RepID=UPI0025D38666|nr:hypothetical protein [uncultured Succiniclasticum sp.]